MEARIDGQMIAESFGPLCRAPGFSKQSVYISSEHCAGVIQTKQRIESHFLEFPLPGYTTPLSFESFMVTCGKEFLYVINVVRIFIGLDLTMRI